MSKEVDTAQQQQEQQEGDQQQALPDAVQQVVLLESADMPEGTPVVRGYDFNDGIDFDALMSTYKFMGFQATNVGRAIDEVNRMLNWRLSDEPLKEDDAIQDATERANTRCKIFLGYTSNLISSGMRSILRYLVQHKLVDCVVTTAGGIEEDFIKCLAPTYMGDWSLSGRALRKQGMNRIGNLLVPNKNYCAFEDWIMPILDDMVVQQRDHDVHWTPSRMIAHLGAKIDNPDSVYYWAAKNDIPVYCPAITDGSIGDMLYFHSFKNPGLRLDLVEDIRGMNNQAVFAPKTGMVILGGGVVKHHICNANLMRNGADFSVFINTGQEYDGSDAGARPDEAISWGKIRMDADPVKVHADATIVFPLVVAQSFAKYHERGQTPEKGEHPDE